MKGTSLSEEEHHHEGKNESDGHRSLKISKTPRVRRDLHIVTSPSSCAAAATSGVGAGASSSIYKPQGTLSPPHKDDAGYSSDDSTHKFSRRREPRLTIAIPSGDSEQTIASAPDSPISDDVATTNCCSSQIDPNYLVSLLNIK